MPAAAVIPTPGVSMVDAAVKGSVVWAATNGCGLSVQASQGLAERTGGVVYAGER